MSIRSISMMAYLMVMVGLTTSMVGQEKIIRTVDDIPRFSYEVSGLASTIFQDDVQFKELYKQVEKNQLMILNEYSFEDVTLRKGILNTLKQIDFFEGRIDDIREKVEEIRALEEKPAAKLISGITNIAYLMALSDYSTDSPEFRAAFRKNFDQLLSGLPFDVVQDVVEQSKGSLEIYSENLMLGQIQEYMDKIVEENQELSGDFANTLVSYKYIAEYILPYKQEMIAVYEAYLDANYVKKENIWEDRDIDLTYAAADLSPVTLAVWDSGVDTDIFDDQLFINENEVLDGLDNDGNGYIDDIHGIAYNLTGDKTIGPLMDLTEEQLEKLPGMVSMMKGISDLQANINSEEASELKQRMASIEPQEVKGFIEEVGLFSNFAHGTHVAGITAQGNPGARVMYSRITFDYHMIPMKPTIELAKKSAVQARETIEYYRKMGVRVVNMSFGGTPGGIETALELNGVADAEERKKLAREIFDIEKAGFYEAIKSAPEILFVAAAGNSDEDAEFYEAIPSSFDLANILTVGAVDQAGEETGFTSFGENVDVHANGFEVDSYIPGGQRMEMSGTSMASPNVANLAGKLLAINPDLSVNELVDLILRGCELSEDGRINLINPRKSVALLASMKG